MDESEKFYKLTTASKAPRAFASTFEKATCQISQREDTKNASRASSSLTMRQQRYFSDPTDVIHLLTGDFTRFALSVTVFGALHGVYITPIPQVAKSTNTFTFNLWEEKLGT